MERDYLNVRGKALGIGALSYTALKSGAVLESFETLLGRWLPTLAASSGVGLKVVRSVIEALALITLVALAERALLLWKTRKIRGEWIYKSSSTNWGHVKIDLTGTDLRYSVDLYKDKSDLVDGVINRAPGRRFAHGFDRSTMYTGYHFYVWYRVPATRFGDVDYPERSGLLTLTPTNEADNYAATWERTGSMTVPPKSRAAATAEITRLDKSSPAGSFYFFIRKEVFETNVKKIET